MGWRLERKVKVFVVDTCRTPLNPDRVTIWMTFGGTVGVSMNAMCSLTNSGVMWMFVLWYDSEERRRVAFPEARACQISVHRLSAAAGLGGASFTSRSRIAQPTLVVSNPIVCAADLRLDRVVPGDEAGG